MIKVRDAFLLFLLWTFIGVLGLQLLFFVLPLGASVAVLLGLAGCAVFSWCVVVFYGGEVVSEFMRADI